MIQQCLAALITVLVFPMLTSSVDEDGILSLTVHQAKPNVSDKDLLNPNHFSWGMTRDNPLHFHRTPQLYSNGPSDDGERPKASVRMIRLSSGTILIKLEWLDSSGDNFLNGSRLPDRGEKHIYKSHTVHSDQFGDAACLMIPQSRKSLETYPSMMMGDKSNPVDLFFWQAGRGFSILNAHGRASTQETPRKLMGKSFRHDRGWEIVFSVQDVANATPVCFAIWDGTKDHRDGLKYYSLWYEIKW